MEIILLLVSSISNIVCLVVGAKVGQTVSKGETIEMPSVNPIEAIREHNDKREADREQDRLETIMRNIERYDGSANGQEDV
jgi:hypothetical protein